MRVLVLDFSTQVREGFITALLPAGFEVTAIKDKKDLIPTLSKKQYEVAVLEVNEQDKEIIQMLRILRTNEAFKNLKIIVHVASPSKQFIIEMIKLGIIGTLLKPFSDRGILQRFQHILQKANIQLNEQRRHVRVKPGEKDKITVTFRSPVTHKVISGNVVDISAGGVAFELFGAVNDDEVKVRQFINNFQIQINRSLASTPALVIARRNKLVAVQYYKIQEYDLNILCKYIYDRLSAGDPAGQREEE